MDIKVKGGELVLRHKLKKNETYKIQKKDKYEAVYIFKKPQICKGFSSKTEDGHHILLMDYDEVDYSVVQEDVRLVQEEFGLPSAYIFYTKEEKGVGNYHAIFLSKHTPEEILKYLSYCSVDENFIDSPMRSKYRSWVLRIGAKRGRNKPKFKEILNIDIIQLSDYEISTAHKDLLTRIYPKIKHPTYKLEDNLKKVKIQEYETR